MKIQCKLFLLASALGGVVDAKKTKTRSTKGTRNMIVNGEPVGEAYPFYGFFEIGCGASIVAPDMVLTAAHCDTLDKLIRRIWLGSTELYNGTERTVVDRIPHPEYQNAWNSSGAYDIMLMRVNSSLLVDSDGNPTMLETVPINGDASIPEANQELRVIGHGLSDVYSWDLEDNLLEVPLFAYDDEVCIDIYNQTEEATSGLTVLPESMFCAGQGPEGFGGTCNGDSGGPIIDPETGVQVGVVSWGHACSLYGYPSVFGRVSSAYDWIKQQICENSCFPDRENCPSDTVFHPCAEGEEEADAEGEDFLSSGNINLNLTILSDPFPEEIAFAMEHVESGKEVYFMPYQTYSQEDVAELEYGEYLVIENTFSDLPSGTYHIAVGDSFGDGICCAGNASIILSFQETGEEIWTHDGTYGAGLDIYVQFEEDGTVVFVSRSETGVDPPTAAPSAYLDPYTDDYPGEFPDEPFEVMINVHYDSYMHETYWSFQRQLKENETADATVEVQNAQAENGWTTIASGPDLMVAGDTLYSYNQSNLLPNTLYRFVFNDFFGDGIFSWGATITNSTASDEYMNGTLLWSLPVDTFRTHSEAYIWIDEEGHSRLMQGYGAKVPKAPIYLDAACTQVGLAAAPEICEDTCARAECCWNTTGGDVCTSRPECADYGRCANLLEEISEEVEDLVETAGDLLEDASNALGGLLGRNMPPYDP